jgi:hypothetical protein
LAELIDGLIWISDGDDEKALALQQSQELNVVLIAVLKLVNDKLRKAAMQAR